MKTLTLTAILIIVLAGMVYAGCGGCGAGPVCGQAADEASITNDTCPVMGGAVDKNTPHQASYQGKKIGFCCAQRGGGQLDSGSSFTWFRF